MCQNNTFHTSFHHLKGKNQIPQTSKSKIKILRTTHPHKCTQANTCQLATQNMQLGKRSVGLSAQKQHIPHQFHTNFHPLKGQKWVQAWLPCKKSAKNEFPTPKLAWETSFHIIGAVLEKYVYWGFFCPNIECMCPKKISLGLKCMN